MELSIPPALVYVASWLSVTGGVWALFDRAESVATEDAKQAIARWLRNLDPAGPLAQWPTTFAAVFDRVFGARHLSWRCFGRSCVASVASVAIVTGIWVVVRRAEAVRFITTDLADSLLLGLAVILLTLVINTLPDYLSLLKTRYVIRWMTTRPSLGRIGVGLALDGLLTTTLAAGVIVGVASRVSLNVAGLPQGLAGAATVREFVLKRVLPLTSEQGIPVIMQVDVYFPASQLKAAADQIEREVPSASKVRPPAPPPLAAPGRRRDAPPQFVISGIPWGIFFYSTFFTSVWVWLYAGAGGLLRLAASLGITFRRMRWFLDIENKPLRSLGMVSIVLITLGYLVMPLVR